MLLNNKQIYKVNLYGSIFMVPPSLYLLLLSVLSQAPVLLMLLCLSLLQCSESSSFLLFKISGMFGLHVCLGFEEALCNHVRRSCLWPSMKLYIFAGKNWVFVWKVLELPVLETWFIHPATRWQMHMFTGIEIWTTFEE